MNKCFWKIFKTIIICTTAVLMIISLISPFSAYRAEKYGSVQPIREMFRANYDLFSETAKSIAANTSFWVHLTEKNTSRIIVPYGYNHEKYFSDGEWQRIKEIFDISKPRSISLLPLGKTINGNTSRIIYFEYVVNPPNQKQFSYQLLYMYTYGNGNIGDIIQSREELSRELRAYTLKSDTLLEIDENWYELESKYNESLLE